MTALKMLLGSMGTMALLCLAMPVMAQLPDDLREGIRVEAEGQRLDDKTFTAEEVEIQARRAGKDEVAGPITEVDHEKRTLRIHATLVRLGPDTLIENDANDEIIELSEFKEGLYGEAEGMFRNGAIQAEQVKLVNPDAGEELKVELSGIVTSTNAAGSSFSTLGIEVLVTPRTVIEMK